MNKESTIEQSNITLWDDFLSILPPNWAEIAQNFQVMKGAKRDKDLANALRVILIHLGVGSSLKETVAYAKTAGLCNISSVSLYHRLVKFGPFFHELCKQLLNANAIASFVPNIRLFAVDASDVKEPGPTGSRYRYHYCVSLADLSCNHMELTSIKGKGAGESLRHFPVAPGDHFIADRGYATPQGVAYVANRGGYTLIRLNHGSLPLYTRTGQPFPLQKNLSTLVATGDTDTWNCQVKDPESGEWIKGRLCAIRKDPESIQKSLAEAKEKSRQGGKTITEKTLELCQYTILFTTFDPKKFPLQKILDIYRWRWQIELVFKRFKSLIALGCLPKTTDESSKAWLYGKMLLALLIEKVAYQQRSFSPWREVSTDPIELQRQLMAAL